MTGDPVLDSLEFQWRGVERASPLYHRVLAAVIDDYQRGGVCRAVLTKGPAIDPISDALTLRFLGGVHRLVLTGRAPSLAAHYASAGGAYDPDIDPAADFLATVEEHRDDLEAALWRPVQTNEVGRCAALIIGILELSSATTLPLRLLEIGASAGLNLLLDRYRYEGGVDGSAWGPASSPLRMAPYRDPLPQFDGRALSIASREGCDRSPLDPRNADDRLALRAFVWPDQVTRLAQLDAALSIAVDDPAPVVKADAAGWLPDRLTEPGDGVMTVLFHSSMWQYLPDRSRRAIERAMQKRGKRASAAAPLAWLRLEPGDDPEKGAELRLTTWPGGEERRLARAGYHGMPVRLESPPAPT